MYPKGLIPTIVQEKWWETPVFHDVQSLNKNKRDVLLVVGDATGVVDDLGEFLKICPGPFDTMAINYSHLVIPWEIQHFVAGDSHMEDMQRSAALLPENCIKHCWNPNSKGFHYRWIRNGKKGWNGTTANLCIKIGIALGYTRIVLAGVPMDNSGNWYSPFIPEKDVKQGKNHTAHLWKWHQIAARPISRLLRSMSGNTADILGKPTEKWLLEPEILNEELRHAEREKKEFAGKISTGLGADA